MSSTSQFDIEKASQVVEAVRAANRSSSFHQPWEDATALFAKYVSSREIEPKPILEAIFSGLISNLELLKEGDDQNVFYQLFANFTKADSDFTTAQVKEYIRSKLDEYAREPLSLNPQVSFSAWLGSLNMPSQRRMFANQEELLDVAVHFSEQFATPFKGNSQLRFLRFALGILAFYDGSKGRELYFMGSSIVQSSGTGKTRLVLELANYAPLLYICLRTKDSTALHGFPQGDDRPVEYFSHLLRKQKADKEGKPTGELLYCFDLQVAAFLGAWFTQLADELHPLPTPQQKHEHLIRFIRYAPTDVSSRSKDSPDIVSKANQATILQTERIRRQFFNKVYDAASLLLQKAPPPDGLHNQAIFQHCLDSAILSLAKELGAVRDYLYDQMSMVDRQFLQESISKKDNEAFQLAGAGKRRLNPRELPIFVAFDECVLLIAATVYGKKEDHQHQLNSLRRAWHYIGEREAKHSEGLPRFWLVLMSTNSAASILVEKSEARGSDRAKGKALTPTWVNMGFDLMRHGSKPLTCARAVGNLEHLRTYGRPLWVSLRTQDFWSDAQLKLLNSPDSYDQRWVRLGASTMVQSVKELHYAILASRLALSFCPAVKGEPDYKGIEQDKLATGAVDRHMRVLRSIEDGYRLNVSSPSEPVLAIMATLIMLPVVEVGRNEEFKKEHGQQRYRTILDRFQASCLPVLTNQDALKGSVGELIARIVLMVARDAARLKHLVDFPQDRQDTLVPSRASDVDEEESSAASRFSPSLSASRPVSVTPSPRSPYASSDERLKVVHSPLLLRDLLDQVCTLSTEDQKSVDERLEWVRAQLVSRVASSIDPANEQVDLWINFTHFDDLSKSTSEISGDYLWYCWKRGVAIQTTHVQEGIDGIIPVFVGDLDCDFRKEILSSDTGSEAEVDTDSVAARHMTYIAWQAKHRSSSASTKEMEKLRGPLLKMSGAPAITEKGVLTLFMEMGVETPFNDSTSPCPMTKVQKWTDATDAQEKSSRKRPHDDVEMTAQERAAAIPAKKRSSTGKSKATLSIHQVDEHDEHDDETVPAEPSSRSEMTAWTQSHPPMPTACQKGFLLIKIRGVAHKDVYPGLQYLNVRDTTVNMVTAYLKKKKKPFFERDNRITMPLDVCDPERAVPIVEGEGGASSSSISSRSKS